MKRLLFLACTVCILVGLASGKLVRLDDDNLDRNFATTVGKDWVILFANKKTTDPELVQTFHDFAEVEENFVVGAVECTSDPDLCLDFEISKRSGPVLMLVTAAGDRIKYTGEEQTSAAWKKWAYKVRHGSVHVLTHNTWNQSVSDGEWFVKYYAPWCAHCNQIAPLWSDFSEEHKDEFNVAKFDCTLPEHQSVCGTQGVTGFPTFVFYIDGYRFPHTGERTKEQFMRTVDRARAGMLEDDEEQDEVMLKFEPPKDRKSDPYDEL